MKFQIIKTQKLERLQQDYDLLLADVTNATAFIKTIENGTLDSNYAGLEMTGTAATGSLAEALLSI